MRRRARGARCSSLGLRGRRRRERAGAEPPAPRRREPTTSRYDVRIVPTERVAHVAIAARPIRANVIALAPLPRSIRSASCEFRGDGEVRRRRRRHVAWTPPRGGGTLRYAFRIDHLRDERSYDARCAENWAIFRGDDLVPPRARAHRGRRAESRARLRCALPKGWRAVTPYPRAARRQLSRSSTRTAASIGRPAGCCWARSACCASGSPACAWRSAAPRGQRVRRQDLLALLRWTLPTLREIARRAAGAAARRRRRRPDVARRALGPRARCSCTRACR